MSRGSPSAAWVVFFISCGWAAEETPFYKKVTVRCDKVPVADVLKDVAVQAGVRLTVPEKLLEGWEPATYAAEDQEAGRVLTRLLRPRGLGLDIRGPAEAQVTRLADIDEFKVKRESTFDFAEKPRIQRDGDRVAISFSTKAWCDATVAIEDAQGRIVRHLASGVLGPNAPEPFQWNSKKQTLVWNGKNDKGEYVDDKNNITVRVSLGLKSQFERNFMWEPKRRVGKAAPLIQPTPEGVYVYDADYLTEHLRLFDHRGAYVRTVFPFPASQLDKVEGLQRRPSELDGTLLPAKPDRPLQSHLLTTGLIRDALDLESMGGSQDQRLNGVVLAMAATGGKVGRIALVNDCLNRLSPEGSTGGIALTGPRTAVPVRQGGEGGKPMEVGPTSAALSPDGKWLYLTGYQWKNLGHYAQKEWLHGVTRMAFGGKTPPELFAGNLKQGQDQAGSEPSKFNLPAGVACDGQGRVYVADHVNDRIQVFQPDGKFLKAIPVTKPVWVAIHHETQEIYVGSWSVSSAFIDWRKPVAPTLTQLGPLVDPKVLASYPLPVNAGGSYQDSYGDHCRVALDSWTNPPTLWLVPGSPMRWVSGNLPWEQVGIRLLVEKNGSLVEVADFGKEGLAFAKHGRPAHNTFLAVNPADGHLFASDQYGAECQDPLFSFRETVEIDPATGKMKVIPLPFPTIDLAFDLDGMAYLRRPELVVRFDPKTWQEVPWDYGEERSQGFVRAVSGLPVPVVGYKTQGGMSISPKGCLAVACRSDNEGPSPDQRAAQGTVVGQGNVKPYKPRLYPGRLTGGTSAVHVFDRHGRLVHEDAVPGLSFGCQGVWIDASDSLYVLGSARRLLRNGTGLDEGTGTLLKFRPKACRLLSARGAAIPLEEKARPGRPPDTSSNGGSSTWVEGAEWFYGGAGWMGLYNGPGCVCFTGHFALDLYSRSFVPEPIHYTVSVLDSSGNVILRVGRYGNEDSAGPQSRESLGGDEVGLFLPRFVATHSDRRLFIQDTGNARIVSARLGYHTTETVALKDVKDLAR